MNQDHDVPKLPIQNALEKLIQFITARRWIVICSSTLSVTCHNVGEFQALYIRHRNRERTTLTGSPHLRNLRHLTSW